MEILIETDKIDYIAKVEAQKVADDVIDKLVAKRKELKLTQQDIADRVGMPRANISRMERKQYPPTLALMIRYATSLGMELSVELIEK